MMGEEPNEEVLVSSGYVAQYCGVGLAAVKHAEAAGRIVPAIRVLGSDRRVWLSTDLPKIKRQLEQPKNKGGRPRRAAA